jgi:hypothetical protein
MEGTRSLAFTPARIDLQSRVDEFSACDVWKPFMIRLRRPHTAARVIADLDRVLSAGYLSQRVHTGILRGL